MAKNEINAAEMYRRKALRICKQFYYNDDVISEVKKAKTSDQISVIMHNARNGAYDKRKVG